MCFYCFALRKVVLDGRTFAPFGAVPHAVEPEKAGEAIRRNRRDNEVVFSWVVLQLWNMLHHLYDVCLFRLIYTVKF